MSDVVALTKKQREYIREERNGGRCQHFYREGGKWKQCPCNSADGCELHVHHITSQRFGDATFSDDYDGDRPGNTITICKGHHISGRSCGPDCDHH